jgi:hypothetical protein
MLSHFHTILSSNALFYICFLSLLLLLSYLFSVFFYQNVNFKSQGPFQMCLFVCAEPRWVAGVSYTELTIEWMSVKWMSDSSGLLRNQNVLTWPTAGWCGEWLALPKGGTSKLMGRSFSSEERRSAFCGNEIHSMCWGSQDPGWLQCCCPRSWSDCSQTRLGLFSCPWCWSCILFSFVGGTRVWAQDLVLARQVLYHAPSAPSLNLIFINLFFISVSQLYKGVSLFYLQHTCNERWSNSPHLYYSFLLSFLLPFLFSSFWWISLCYFIYIYIKCTSIIFTPLTLSFSSLPTCCPLHQTVPLFTIMLYYY